MNSEYKIKEYKGKIKDKDGKNDKFEIVKFETKDPKITVGEDGKGTVEVEATIKIADDKGKFGEEQKGKKVLIEYERGTFSHYGKIKKVNNEEVQAQDVSFSGMGSWRLTFWAAITVFVLLIVGLIWWWIASSRKEDKEEESL